MLRRINRVNQLLQEELAKLIQEDFKENLVTVTVVEAAKDLKTARVWITTFSNQKKVLGDLEKKAPSYQHILGKKLFIKNTPKLLFHFDRGNEKVARVEKILNKL